MEMKTDKTCLTGLALLALSVCNPPAYGAGLWLYEMGTPDVGTPPMRPRRLRILRA